MGAWENELLRRANSRPFKWYRFFDDIWGIWTHGEKVLRVFHDLANQIHPNINVELRVTDTSIEFLDVEVMLSDSGYISTNLFTKPTDARAYLYYASEHPSCMKRGWGGSPTQGMGIHSSPTQGIGDETKRICSKQSDYQDHRENLISRLCERGFPKGQVIHELCKVDRMGREDLLGRRGRKSSIKEGDRVPMVITYSGFLPDIRAIMKRTDTFYTDQTE